MFFFFMNVFSLDANIKENYAAGLRQSLLSFLKQYFSRLGIFQNGPG